MLVKPEVGYLAKKLFFFHSLSFHCVDVLYKADEGSPDPPYLHSILNLSVVHYKRNPSPYLSVTRRKMNYQWKYFEKQRRKISQI